MAEPVSPELLALLDEFSARNLSLRAEGDRLLARGPQGALTEELRTALARHKAALVELLRRQQDERAEGDPTPVAREGDPPLSFAQERLWFLIQLAPESSAAYNIVAPVRIQGALRDDVLERALDELVGRHETLRTGFVSNKGRPAQRIAPAASAGLRRLDLSGAPEAEQEAALQRLLADEARTPFEIRTPPLLRATLVRRGARDHVLIFVIHHLVSDDWSSGVIVREVGELYDAFAAGRSSPLPPLPIQFADYVAWQRDRLAGPALDALLGFWKGALAGLQALHLPTDHPRPPVMSYAGAWESFALPAALADRLGALARREGATLFMTLLAAFETLLHRYTGQVDVAVGSSIANRGRKSLEGLIGFLTNTLVLRSDLSGNPRFVDLLARVRNDTRQAYEHQELPFEKLVEEMQPERILSVNPLFQVCFSLLQPHRDALHLGDLVLRRLDPVSQTSRFDLTLTLEDAEEGLLGVFEYRTDLFEASTIRRMIEHLGILLEGIAEAPETRIGDLPLLPPHERRRVVVEWNATATNYPRDACVHQLFEEQVRRLPDAVALVAGGRTLSYGELNARANRLARRLRRRGVGPEVAVAVCAERSVEMVVSLLATLKAGGHYVPFDPSDPRERLAYLFAQVRPALVLAPERHHPRLPGEAAPLWDPERDAAAIAAEPADDLTNLAAAENLAYTTYTSGSTGLPKGIAVPHRGVVRLVRDTNYLPYDASLVVLELAPVSFDASTFELWGALASGARLVVMPPAPPSLRELGEAIARHGVTSLYLTSALFNLMVDERVEAFRGVRHLLVGGDVISVPHARKVLAAHPGLTLINGYGPTETTTFAACGMLTSPDLVGHTVTIGPPISNTTLYVLDPRSNPAPIGVPGDLFIGGDGNARGYLDPALTAASFLPNPYGAGERIYRTGDRARWRSDGTLEFLGRSDNQVKVRGFRIEPGEVENVLAGHPEVQEVVILVHGEAAGDKRLVAYVQPVPGAAAGEPEWIAFLRGRLPDYMIPSSFVPVAAFPLTPHNKIDRGALAALGGGRGREAEGFVAPRTPVEEVLASLWAEVLGVERVGADESFFDLGGHSLLATQLMWRVYDAFGIELPLRRLFESPTVARFAAALEAADGRAGRVAALARLRLAVDRMSPEQIERALRDRGAAP